MESRPVALVKRASDHRKTAEFPGEISDVNGVYRYGKGSELASFLNLSSLLIVISSFLLRSTQKKQHDNARRCPPARKASNAFLSMPRESIMRILGSTNVTSAVLRALYRMTTDGISIGGN